MTITLASYFAFLVQVGQMFAIVLGPIAAIILGAVTLSEGWGWWRDAPICPGPLPDPRRKRHRRHH
jgi:hypothetical protein